MTTTNKHPLPAGARILTAVEMNNIHLPMSGSMPPRKPDTTQPQPAIPAGALNVPVSVDNPIDNPNP